MERHHSSKAWAISLCILPVLVVLVSIFIGPSAEASPRAVFVWLISMATPGSHSHTQGMVETILLDVRLPRILLALVVGAALTASGSSLQALMRNPLVSPDILGLSSGAAFGAALSMSLHWMPLQPAAFLFGLLATALSTLMAGGRRGFSMTSLILAGVITSGIFTALLTIVQIYSDPFKLQTIVHWTMGNLHNASWSKLRSAGLPVLAGAAALMFLRWRLNAISMGDDEMRAVGLNPTREKILVLIPATLIASAAVAVAGIIGMIGLVVPHMIRMLIGPDNRKVLPVSLAFGGAFLVLVDDFARAITSFEVPVGIFTTLISGPIFFYLLKKHDAGFREN